MGLTIEILHLGNVRVDSSLVVLNNPPGTRVRMPTYAYLIRGSSAGPVLVDTGFRDPGLLELVGMEAFVEPGQSLDQELARRGLRPADIRYILHTHLHLDHAGQDSLFPMETTVVVNRRELEVAAGMGTWAYLPQDTKHIIDRVYTPEAAWLLDLAGSGPVEILPGIVCELAGGHTEGSMNVLVETDDGVACICGDIIYNIQEQLIRSTFQLQHHEYRTTGYSAVSQVQEKGAVKKVVHSGRWILPMHDQPAKVDRGGVVVGRLAGLVLPGPTVPLDFPLLDTVVDAEEEGISPELANSWLC
jgi:glyoxylase-like metal-dependent hydrolase (beta-lactamase superfamily II)